MADVMKALLVLEDGRKIQVELIGENSKTLNTYIREGSAGVTLLDYSNKEKSMPMEMMLDGETGKLYVTMPDGSIISPTTGSEDQFDMIKKTLLEVHDKEVKDSIAPKHFYKILSKPKEEVKNYEEFYTYIENEKRKNAVDTFTGVLTTYEYLETKNSEGVIEGTDQKRIIIPFTDVSYVLVPFYNENGFRDRIITLEDYLKEINENTDALVKEIWDQLYELDKIKEDKQTDGKKGNLAYSDSATFSRFKVGLSLYRLYNDGTYANGWIKILTTLKIRVGEEALLMVYKSEPIIDDYTPEKKPIYNSDDMNNQTTIYQRIFSIGTNGVRTYAERSLKHGDQYTTNFLYINHDDLDMKNIVAGDKSNARSRRIDSISKITNSGFYTFENQNAGENDSPPYRDFVNTNAKDSEGSPILPPDTLVKYYEKTGKIFVTAESRSVGGNQHQRKLHMIFISDNGNMYYTMTPSTIRITYNTNNLMEEEIVHNSFNKPTWERITKSDEIRQVINKLQELVSVGYEKIQINDKINDISYEESLQKDTFKEGLSIRRLRTDSTWNDKFRLYNITHATNAMLYTFRTPKVGSESDFLHQTLILSKENGYIVRLERIITGDGTDKMFTIIDNTSLDNTIVLSGDPNQGKSKFVNDIRKIYETGIYTFNLGQGGNEDCLPVDPTTSSKVKSGSIIAFCKRTKRTNDYLDELNMYFISSLGAFVTSVGMQVIESRSNPNSTYPSSLSVFRNPKWSKVITTDNGPDLIKAADDTILVDEDGKIKVNPKYIGKNKNYTLEPESLDGWYRIMETEEGIFNASGTYKLTISKAGYNDIIEFKVLTTFNDIDGSRSNKPTLDIISRKHYKDIHIIQGIRLVTPKPGESTAGNGKAYIDIRLNMRDTANGRLSANLEVL